MQVLELTPTLRQAMTSSGSETEFGVSQSSWSSCGLTQSTGGSTTVGTRVSGVTRPPVELCSQSVEMFYLNSTFLEFWNTASIGIPVRSLL